MALDKTLLGTDLYNRAQAFNDVDIADLEQARKDYWQTIAEGIINHFKANGIVNVAVATTGTATAQTGTGTGSIS